MYRINTLLAWYGPGDTALLICKAKALAGSLSSHPYHTFSACVALGYFSPR